MSAHSDILGELSVEQLHDGIRMLNEQIHLANEESRTEDAIVYVTTRNAIQHEIEVRASKEEGGVAARPSFSMTVSAHYVLRIMNIRFPEMDQEELMRNFEYDIRTMSNECGAAPWYSAETASWPPKVPYTRLHSSQWPAMRTVAPLAIIHTHEQEAMFTNAAPPLNAWWAAEDRIKDAPLGTWELVWREYFRDDIHEGWVERVSEEGFLHYLTRYKGGEESPLPLSK